MSPDISKNVPEDAFRSMEAGLITKGARSRFRREMARRGTGVVAHSAFSTSGRHSAISVQLLPRRPKKSSRHAKRQESSNTMRLRRKAHRSTRGDLSLRSMRVCRIGLWPVHAPEARASNAGQVKGLSNLSNIHSWQEWLPPATPRSTVIDKKPLHQRRLTRRTIRNR
jgi:hypothetical protein